MTCQRNGAPPGAGKSSFELIDARRLFAEIPLGQGMVLFDMGCGEGRYALALAENAGGEGFIYALDLWKEGIARLQEDAAARGLKNIQARVGDLADRTPLEDRSADVCLMATVLHDLVLIKKGKEALREVCRVLKPGGIFAVLEFKKIDGPPGPPIRSRLAPEEVEEWVLPFGFEKMRTVEVGPYNDLTLFTRNGAGSQALLPLWPQNR